MDKIKVAVSDLKTHLYSNRAKHLRAYELAMDAYRDRLTDELSDMLDRASRGEDINHTIDVTRPASFITHYDTAIAMMEWTVDTEVELDHQQFLQYVQDEWTWNKQFLASTAMYNRKG